MSGRCLTTGKSNLGKRTHVPLRGLLLLVVAIAGLGVLAEFFADNRIRELDVEILLSRTDDLVFGRSSEGASDVASRREGSHLGSIGGAPRVTLAFARALEIHEEVLRSVQAA